MIAYWGRRGAASRIALELAEAARRRGGPGVALSLSSTNEAIDRFASFGDDVFTIDTFRGGAGAVLGLPRVAALRRRLRRRFAEDGTAAFVSLMPHLWSPLVVPAAVRGSGVRHIVVVHDAAPHPGDLSGLAAGWLAREARHCDRVVTLSRHVAEELAARRGIARSRITPLFHPDLTFGRPPAARAPPAGPPRLLFIGRLLRYKGFGMFVAALEELRRSGRRFEVGVFGSGDITEYRGRLAALGAEVANRWIDDAEFPRILARHDIVVLAHTEASQSGIIAAAHGAGLPVVTTPIGGLVEQVVPDLTGILARAATAEELAAAIARALDQPGLLDRLFRGVAATRDERSMARFLDRLTEIALPARPEPAA